MFTPPPSPLPVPPVFITDEKEKQREELLTVPSLALNNRDDENMQASRSVIAAIAERHSWKQRTARRTRWAILFVPAILILVALTTRRVSTFGTFDEMSKPTEGWLGVGQRHGPGHHKRAPQTLSLSDPVTSLSSSFLIASTATQSTSEIQSATSTSSLSQTQQTIPPVPNASNPPTLPTPFPQPYDTTGSSSNVTTQTCQAFFDNMTQTEPFRQCRSFSLLEQFSSEFIQAQTNLSALNAIIYGTCNTTLSFSTCISNMDWFASALSAACSTELSENNAMVAQTLLGLKAYALLRTAGCLVDQQTNTYCYEFAVHASSPADVYLYQLPFGIGFPSTTTPSCSTCAGSLLSVYADALKSGNSSVDGLKDTYDSAAQSAEEACGSGYAQLGLATSGAAGRRHLDFGKDRWIVMAFGVLAGMLLVQ